MEERYVRTDPPTLCFVVRSLKLGFRHNFRVLVPGAGLGRLAYDVAKLGERIPQLFLGFFHRHNRIHQAFPARATSFRTSCC